MNKIDFYLVTYFLICIALGVTILALTFPDLLLASITSIYF